MSLARLRVVVADPSPVVRAGLRSILLQGRFHVVAQTGVLEEVVPLVRSERPQLVLLDQWPPGGEGFGLIAPLRTEEPGARIIVMAADSHPDHVLRAISLGANGFLPKRIAPGGLLSMLERAVGEEKLFRPREVHEALLTMAGGHGGPRDPWGEPVEGRDLELLRLLAQGLSNREMGEALSLTPGTVANQVHRLLRRLALADRTHAAVWAVRHGLAAGPAAGRLYPSSPGDIRRS